MLSESLDFIDIAPWMMLFPGLAIVITVLGFVLLGDGLRDAFDPKMKN
jgi:peptide/nickel transport system permease protein